MAYPWHAGYIKDNIFTNNMAILSNGLFLKGLRRAWVENNQFVNNSVAIGNYNDGSYLHPVLENSAYKSLMGTDPP